MHPTQYFSRARLDRRSFLKWFLFSLSAGVIPWGVTAPPKTYYFYWTSLKTGKIEGDSKIMAPHGLPGSLMKLVTTAALVEEQLFSMNTPLTCTGQIRINHRWYHCQTPHGTQTLPEALSNSCNVFFAQAVERLSPHLFLKYARYFGLDSDVSGFGQGIFSLTPDAVIQDYALGLTPALQPTPLQILRMTAQIACQGEIPKAMQSMHSASSDTVTLSKHTCSILGSAMRAACQNGTARHLDPQNCLHVAAKTGTAPHGRTYQSWLTGFFPFEDPQYAFSLWSNHGTSHDTCVPLGRRLLASQTWS
jgi:cell division protein FtsI/penicillin-binding protein 2